MNKKFSTLVASLLLGTSFGAFAQTAVTAGDAIEKGGEYFLLNSDKVLAVQKDSLAFVANASITGMTRAERAFATWTVSYEVSPTGAYTYSFVNKGTGQKLQLPASGKALAYVANGVNQFAWLAANKAEDDKLISTTTADGAKLMPYPVFVAQEDITGVTSSMVNYAQLTAGYEGIQVVQDYGTALTEAITFLTFSGTSEGQAVTVAEIQKAKDLVKAIDAAFAQFGLNRLSTALANYKTWADAVDQYVTPTADPGDIQSEAIITAKAAAKTAVEAILKASPYGYACKVDNKWKGVVYSADGTAIMANTEVYAKGVKFINGAAMAKLQAAKLDADDFVAGDDVINTVISDKANDPTYVATFVKEFKTGTQADKEVSTALDFTQGGSPAAENNVLAGKNIQLVQRNLLINETSGASAIAAVAANATDFNAATMIYDKDAKKYLYVSSNTYEADDTKSTYFKLEWVSLKDLATKTTITSAVADVTYNNLDGKAHAGSAIFKVNYNPNDGAVEIAPRFLYQKKASTLATDTAGVTYTVLNGKTDSYKYVLSLKKFSTATELTVVDKTAESVYPIYATATAAGSDWEVTTTDSDIYYIQYATEDAAKKADNGKFFTAEGLVKGTYEAFNHLPSTQWALVKDANGLVKVVNRAVETKVLKDGKNIEFNNVQLYKAGDNFTTMGGDTLKLTSVASEFKMDSTLGYFAYDAKKNDVLKYQLTYFNELDATKNVGVRKDSTLFVDKSGEGIWFQMKVADAAAEYGADAIKDMSKKLKKATYTIEAIVNGKAYKVVMENGKYAISDKSSNKAAVKFDVKELMHNDLCWYVLNNLTSGNTKVSVDDNTLNLFNEATTEARTSMFALTQGNAPKYRRFGETVVDEIAKNDTAYVEFFKANEPNRFLYENSANIVAENGTEFAKDSLNFLGMYNKADMKRNASIFVDTAYVRNDTIKPLYMLALGVQFTEGKADVPCPDHGMTCEHAIHGAPSYTNGRYLVALNDSTANNPSAMYQGNVRLAFVPAKHIADTLVIANSEFTGVKDKTDKDSLIVNGTNMTAATFAFRLVNDDPADFYIETDGDQYVRIHNGVPVLVKEIEDATIFNVNKTNETPTANEDINASTISVIAKEGAVIISGAQGKKVVITNVLGQTIANTVISSDKAEIAAPAGVVVVAVEGEAAVKAIVK